MSVFSNAISNDCIQTLGFHGTTSHSHFRYCPDCARLGYHSNLHQFEWLPRCPVHGSLIISEKNVLSKSNNFSASHVRLKEVMRRACPTWPAIKERNIIFENDWKMQSLIKWITDVSESVRQADGWKIWSSSQLEKNQSSTNRQIIDRLKSLVPMEEGVSQSFYLDDAKWQLKRAKFSSKVKSDMKRISKGYGFTAIFDFYLIASLYSKDPARYLKKFYATRKLMRSLHGKCRCAWAAVDDPWQRTWVKMNEEDRPLWLYSCPYEIAMKELKFEVGPPHLHDHARQSRLERISFIKLAHHLQELGAIQPTDNALLTEQGLLDNSPDQVWPCCKWQSDQPITKLLECIADIWVDHVGNNLITWLHQVERGRKPWRRHDALDCMQIYELDDGLELWAWLRDAPEAPGAPPDQDIPRRPNELQYLPN